MFIHTIESILTYVVKKDEGLPLVWDIGITPPAVILGLVFFLYSEGFVSKKNFLNKGLVSEGGGESREQENELFRVRL